jgi:hypothetical protein
MEFTDFRTVDLSGLPPEEIIYQIGTYPAIRYVVGGGEGRPRMTVAEAREFQQSLAPLPTFSDMVSQIIRGCHGGDVDAARGIF